MWRERLTWSGHTLETYFVFMRSARGRGQRFTADYMTWARSVFRDGDNVCFAFLGFCCSLLVSFHKGLTRGTPLVTLNEYQVSRSPRTDRRHGFQSKRYPRSKLKREIPKPLRFTEALG